MLFLYLRTVLDYKQSVMGGLPFSHNEILSSEIIRYMENFKNCEK